MQKAKAFFFISMGILALAGAYQIGQSTATAQGLGLLEGPTAHSNGYVSAAFGRTVYYADAKASGQIIPHSIPVPVPGMENIVATAFVTNTETPAVALLENGDLYAYVTSDAGIGDVSEWRYRGNIIGMPVQATETTWGRIKAERR